MHQCREMSDQRARGSIDMEGSNRRARSLRTAIEGRSLRGPQRIRVTRVDRSPDGKSSKSGATDPDIEYKGAPMRLVPLCGVAQTLGARMHDQRQTGPLRRDTEIHTT